MEEIAKIRYFVLSGPNPGSYWIGLSDLEIEGKFLWNSSNTWATILDWYPYQPDNAGDNEHCVEMRKEYGYKWNDRPCSDLLHGICQVREFNYFTSNITMTFDEASEVSHATSSESTLFNILSDFWR